MKHINSTKLSVTLVSLATLFLLALPIPSQSAVQPEQQLLIDSYLTLARNYQEKKDFKTALIYLKEAALINPEDVEIASFASDLLGSLQIYCEDDINFSKVSAADVTHIPAIEPTLPDTYMSIADALRENQHHETAALYLREALQLRPNNITLMFDLANTLNMANYNDESLYLYCQLLTKCPTNKTILYNTAYTFKKIGRMDDAMLFYNAALEQDPEYPEARFSRGLAYLVMGDFEKGWPEYEWRWKRPGYPPMRPLTEPLVDPNVDLNGKLVYLYSEQGLGDTFEFIRYARVMKQRGARVVVSVQNPLVTILSLCPYIDRVIALNQQPVKFDYQAPLMSLPYLLGTTIKTVPTDIPYLYASQPLVAEWKEKLSTEKRFKVGICWQGNANYRTAALRSVVAAKAVPAKKFEKLLEVPNIKLYSLQKETGLDQESQLSPEIYVFSGDFDDSHGRFMDTAAVLENLDLFITVDTSMGHLAAGLGLPVWVFIPNPPDWRWLMDTPDTPWYPNMRLFRQTTPGDWDSVMETVKEELCKVVEQFMKNNVQNSR